MEVSTSSQQRGSYSKPALESYLDLLSRGTLSDVTFIVGPRKERIPCHRAFLIARSPVFEVMFSERWNKKEVPLKEIDPKIFKKFLKFIYADTFDANVPEALELLQVAHTYDVQLLISRVEEFLLACDVPLIDAVDVFQAARKYEKEELMEKVGDVMAKSLSDLQSLPSFSRVDKETLAYILNRDDLEMKEIDLFRLAVKWARNQFDLTIEQSLEDILPLLRFPIMTLEEFTATVVPTGLLSQSTLVEVFTYFGSDAETKKTLAKTLKFNTQRRRPIHYYDLDDVSGDLARKETRPVELEELRDSLQIFTRVTGTTAMGMVGITVYCPPMLRSTGSSRPASSTFKEFDIYLHDLRKENARRFNRISLLVSMSPVKVEEGKMTDIRFDTVVPVENNAHYLLTVHEIPREHIACMYPCRAIKRRHVSVNVINESVVTECTKIGVIDQVKNDNSQLIYRLGLEQL